MNVLLKHLFHMPYAVIKYLDCLQKATFTPPHKDFRTFPYVTKISELLRLDFNNCHMFGRYDTFMCIVGM